MFTTVDKALVAVVMALVFLLNHFTSFHFALDEGTVTSIVGVLTPILVWLVPNAKPAVA